MSLRGSDFEMLETAFPHFVHGFICEDIRREFNFQRTFVGIFGRRYIPKSYPVKFSKLVFVVYIFVPIDVDIEQLSYSISIPGIDEPSGGQASKPTGGIAMDGRMRYTLIIEAPNFFVPAPGLLKAQFVVDGVEWPACSVSFEPPRLPPNGPDSSVKIEQHSPKSGRRPDKSSVGTAAAERVSSKEDAQHRVRPKIKR